MEKRKNIRLKTYDYRSYGGYFVTICTKNKDNYFWKSYCELSFIGSIAEKAIQEIPKNYKEIHVDKYVIMPNHVHILLMNENIEMNDSPSLSRIIKQFKGYVTKQAGFPVWQKSFYDRVIRCQEEYDEIWQYIDNNPIALISDKN